MGKFENNLKSMVQRFFFLPDLVHLLERFMCSLVLRKNTRNVEDKLFPFFEKLLFC